MQNKYKKNKQFIGYKSLACYMLGLIIWELSEEFTKRWIKSYRRKSQMDEASFQSPMYRWRPHSTLTQGVHKAAWYLPWLQWRAGQWLHPFPKKKKNSQSGSKIIRRLENLEHLGQFGYLQILSTLQRSLTPQPKPPICSWPSVKWKDIY